MSSPRAKTIDEELEYGIEELKLFANTFQAQQEISREHIDAEVLEKATSKSMQLLFALRRRIRKADTEGLEEYLNAAIEITSQLHNLAKTDSGRFPPPNLFLRSITGSFEKFTSKIGTKKTRERLRQVASFIPVIDGVVSACGGIPYYFPYANKYEKAAMILAAVLLLTALAMTIAIHSSPAIVGIPLLAPAIAACVLASRVLYDQAAKNAKAAYYAEPKIKNAEQDLAQRTKELRALKDENFPAKVTADIKRMDDTADKVLKFSAETWKLLAKEAIAYRTVILSEGKDAKRKATKKTAKPRNVTRDTKRNREL